MAGPLSRETNEMAENGLGPRWLVVSDIFEKGILATVFQALTLWVLVAVGSKQGSEELGIKTRTPLVAKQCR